MYVGIFAESDSAPSREEYEEAKTNHVPRLVYVKKMREGKDRQHELESFLREVKDAKRGVTICEYVNASELRDQIKHDIMVNTISTYFRDGRNKELREIEATAVTTKPVKELVAEVPSTAIAGRPFNVSASTIATTSKGFFDLLMIAPDGRYLWFPDPTSWKRETDTGSLQLRNDGYRSEWLARLPSSYPEGQYHAMMGLYDDYPQRRLIAKDEKYIDVKKSQHSEVIRLLTELIVRWPVLQELMDKRKLKSPENGEISNYANELVKAVSSIDLPGEDSPIRKLIKDLAILGVDIRTIFADLSIPSDPKITELVSRGETIVRQAQDIIKEMS